MLIVFIVAFIALCALQLYPVKFRSPLLLVFLLSISYAGLLSYRIPSSDLDVYWGYFSGSADVYVAIFAKKLEYEVGFDYLSRFLKAVGVESYRSFVFAFSFLFYFFFGYSVWRYVKSTHSTIDWRTTILLGLVFSQILVFNNSVHILRQSLGFVIASLFFSVKSPYMRVFFIGMGALFHSVIFFLVVVYAGAELYERRRSLRTYFVLVPSVIVMGVVAWYLFPNAEYFFGRVQSLSFHQLSPSILVHILYSAFFLSLLFWGRKRSGVSLFGTPAIKSAVAVLFVVFFAHALGNTEVAARFFYLFVLLTPFIFVPSDFKRSVFGKYIRGFVLANLAFFYFNITFGPWDYYFL